MNANLTIVVAMDAANGIGLRNKLPWNVPADLAHFKRQTLGKPIIMGRKTFESIGYPLLGRRNIVISRNDEWAHEGVERAGSLEEAIKLVADGPASIICGAQIYEQALHLVGTLVVTHIDQESFGCDTFFPKINLEEWQETAHEEHTTGDGLAYAFVTYQRRQMKAPQ